MGEGRRGQEQRCIDLACAHLGTLYAGAWREVDDLEARHRDRPVPEVLVSNGAEDAAIEVKQLLDDDFEAYASTTVSLKTYLTPLCGGYYYLVPPLGFFLPMSRRLRERLKAEIARVAPGMRPGDKRGVRVPRQGRLMRVGDQDYRPPWIRCDHGPLQDLVAPDGDWPPGHYYLVDLADDWDEHTFVSDEARAAFRAAVKAACLRVAAGGGTDVQWFEEWELTRDEDVEDDERNGVWLVSATEAKDVPGADFVQDVYEKARRKFAGERWAKHHVVVLEPRGLMIRPEVVRMALRALAPEELVGVDLLLVVEGDAVTQVYPPP